MPDQEPAIAYQDHELRIQPTVDCGGERAVDLDEPRVGLSSDLGGVEFVYASCGGVVPQIDVNDGLAISTVPGPTSSALDCLRAIRDAPVNEPLTPHSGLTLCLATLRAEAE